MGEAVSGRLQLCRFNSGAGKQEFIGYTLTHGQANGKSGNWKNGRAAKHCGKNLRELLIPYWVG